MTVIYALSDISVAVVYYAFFFLQLKSKKLQLLSTLCDVKISDIC